MNELTRPFDFQRLKRDLTIDRILVHYGLDGSLHKRGTMLYGPCPLHHGDNPTSFRVHLDKNIWHCFSSCGGGDIVELVRRIEDCDYGQAARILRRIASSSSAEPDRKTIVSQLSNSAFRPFSLTIPLSPRAPFLQQIKGISPHTARRFEAGTTMRSTFLKNTVAVRLHDLQGSPIGYCGRRLVPDDIARWGKWRFPYAFPKKMVLFNAHRAAPYRPHGIVVVECPWAVLRLFQAGIPGSVALLGTSLSEFQAAWLANATIVILLLDGDLKGSQAARHIFSSLSASTKVNILDLHQDLEPEDLTDAELASLVRSRLPSL